MGTTPVFSEVIGITFNEAQFAESLQKLKVLYAEALGEMSGAPLGGAVNTSSSAEALKTLTSQVTQLGEASRKTFEELSTQISKSFQKAADTVKQTSAATKRGMRDIVDEAAMGARDYPDIDHTGRFLLQAKEYVHSGLDPKALTKEAQQQVLSGIGSNESGLSGVIAQYEDLNAKQRQWHDGLKAANEAELQSAGKIQSAAVLLNETKEQGINRQMQKMWDVDDKEKSLIDKQNEAMFAANEKKAAAAEAEAQRSGKIVSAAEKENAKLNLADFKTYCEDKVAVSSFSEKEVAALSRQELEVYLDALRAKQAADEKFSATHFAQTQKMISGNERAYASDVRAFETAERKKQREADRTASAEKKAAEKKSQSLGGSFMSSFASNFTSESIGNMAGIVVGYGAIAAAIGTVVKAGEALVEQFKSGFDYLAQLETKAALLQGVIATNVKLSQDFAENYRMAGEASVTIQRSIEDSSIKYGITVEILDRAFKQFVDGGGTVLVHNLTEAAQVTNMLSVALQAAGKDADTSRAIMSELPKMLEGTIKPSSFILETLGLTTKQWDEMGKRARTHHDLLQQMIPLMQNYLNVAAEAGNRQEALTQAIALDMKRIMADGERDAFGVWKESLKAVKKFIEDNRVAISEFVRAIVDVGVEIGNMVVAFAQLLTSTSILPGHANELLIAIRAIAWEFKDIATYLRIAADIITALRATTGDPVADGERMGKVVRDAKKAINELEEEKKHIGDRESDGHHYRYVNGKDTWKDGKDPNPSASTAPWGAGTKPPSDLAPTHYNSQALDDLKKHFELKSKLIDDAYEKEKRANVELVAENSKDIKVAAVEDAAAAAKAYEEQLNNIESFKKQALGLDQGNKGVDPKQVHSFVESLDLKAETASRTEQKRTFDERVRLIKEGKAEKEAADTADIAAAKQVTEEHIRGINKVAQLNHGLTVAQVQDARTWLIESKKTIDDSYNAQLREANEDVKLVHDLTEKKKAFDSAWTEKLNENSDERIAADVREFDRKKQIELSTQELAISQRYGTSTRNASTDGNTAIHAASMAAQANVALAKSEIEAAQASYDHAKGAGAVGVALDEEIRKLNEAGMRLVQAEQELKRSREMESPEGAALFNLGESLKTPFSDFSGTVENLGEAINVFHNSVNQIEEAFKKGGLLGGAGAIASTVGGMASGLAANVGKALGPIFEAGGPILSAIGTLFSSISSIFQQQAQEIAERIGKAVSDAMNAYSNQQATLVQTLQILQQQRQDAISQLSGEKGGQDQLDKLLPQIDQQIAQLQLSIKQAKEDFANRLKDLELNNSALADAFNKWQQINKEVQAYLSAGGSVSEANEYISNSLRDMKQAAGDALNQGYQTAVGDALNLNSLIRQRIQMEKEEAMTEFGLINGDALERRGSKAITVGTQLQIQKAQYKEQLDNLNSTIDLTQQKVALEGQMFDIAMDTAKLRETSNNLQIEQLKEQLAILQGQKDIYEGITQGANGQYGMSNTLMNEIGVVNINVTAGGTAGDTSASSASTIADAVSGVLDTWSRYGMGTHIAKS